MPVNSPPLGWGDDELTKLLNLAINNSYATFQNLSDEYKKLKEIDECFHLAIDNLINTKHWFSAFFLLNAHASFVASVKLSSSGFTSQSFACLRLVLEHSLYGLYISNDKELQEIWLNRHENERSKKKMRDKFTVRNLFIKLSSVNRSVGVDAKNLYEKTIDFGAHPNERALSQSLKVSRDESKVHFHLTYLDDGLALQHSLNTTFLIGLCSLSIFKLIFKDRFEIIGLSDKIRDLRQHGKLQ